MVLGAQCFEMQSCECPSILHTSTEALGSSTTCSNSSLAVVQGVKLLKSPHFKTVAL